MPGLTFNPFSKMAAALGKSRCWKYSIPRLLYAGPSFGESVRMASYLAAAPAKSPWAWRLLASA